MDIFGILDDGMLLFECSKHEGGRERRRRGLGTAGENQRHHLQRLRTGRLRCAKGWQPRGGVQRRKSNVRKGPSTKTAVIAKIPDFEDLPEPYDCLGKVNGWYKINIDGKIGYVRADLMVWDAICTF